MIPVLIVIFIILSIIYILYLSELKNEQLYLEKRNEFIRELLKKPDIIRKYIIDREIELDIYEYNIDKKCKQIGQFSDGTKTYFHEPNLHKCNCGYKLNCTKALEMLNIKN